MPLYQIHFSQVISFQLYVDIKDEKSHNVGPIMTINISYKDDISMSLSF